MNSRQEKIALAELNDKAIDTTEPAEDIFSQDITLVTVSYIQGLFNAYFDTLDSWENKVTKDLKVDGFLGPLTLAAIRSLLVRLGLPKDRLDGPSLEMLIENLPKKH